MRYIIEQGALLEILKEAGVATRLNDRIDFPNEVYEAEELELVSAGVLLTHHNTILDFDMTLNMPIIVSVSNDIVENVKNKILSEGNTNTVTNINIRGEESVDAVRLKDATTVVFSRFKTKTFAIIDYANMPTVVFSKLLSDDPSFFFTILANVKINYGTASDINSFIHSFKKFRGLELPVYQVECPYVSEIEPIVLELDGQEVILGFRIIRSRTFVIFDGVISLLNDDEVKQLVQKCKILSTTSEKAALINRDKYYRSASEIEKFIVEARNALLETLQKSVADHERRMLEIKNEEEVALERLGSINKKYVEVHRLYNFSINLLSKEKDFINHALEGLINSGDTESIRVSKSRIFIDINTNKIKAICFNFTNSKHTFPISVNLVGQNEYTEISNIGLETDTLVGLIKLFENHEFLKIVKIIKNIK